MLTRLHNCRLMRAAIGSAAVLLMLQASLGPHVLHLVFGCSAAGSHAEAHSRDDASAWRAGEGHEEHGERSGVCLACVLAKSLKETVVRGLHVPQLDSPSTAVIGGRRCPPRSNVSPLPIGPRAPPSPTLPFIGN